MTEYETHSYQIQIYHNVYQEPNFEEGMVDEYQMDKASQFTALHAWDSSPHLPLTPV